MIIRFNMVRRRMQESVFFSMVWGMVALPNVLFAQQTLRTIVDSHLYQLFNNATVLFSGVSILFFLWGVATVILHSGNQERLNAGKQRLLWGIIGVVVILSIWGIIRLVQLTIFNRTT